MASHHAQGDPGLLGGPRTRSYGSLSQSSYSPARIRNLQHRVQPGDTLQGLALRYGVTMEQIKRTNRLYTNDSIFLKKHLSIPVLAQQPDLSNGPASRAESGEEGLNVNNPAVRHTEKEGKERRKPLWTGAKEELSASDFMSRIDTSIRVSKRAAVKKLREAETQAPEEEVGTAGAAGYQRPPTGSSEASPQTLQRSLLGPVALTITTRASTIKDHEDEIFKL